jgi:hypothetical protein
MWYVDVAGGFLEVSNMHWTQFIPPLISPAIRLAEKAVEWYGNSKKASSLA